MRHLITTDVRRLYESPAAKPFIAVIAVAAAARLVTMTLPPFLYPDSDGYIILSRQLLTLNLRGYDGHRTPVYPIFLLLGGLNLQVVRVMQNLLGIATAAMLFAMVYRSTRSAAAALAAGLAYGLDISQLSFEQLILTETLCAFMVTWSALALQRTMMEKRSGWREYAVLGTLVGLTALTRPLYAYLAPLYLLILAMISRRERAPLGQAALRLGSFAAPAGALVLGWCMLNWVNVHDFSLATFRGYGMSNVCGAFVELAPDKYAFIRDPYLKTRAKQIATTGTHAMTIFYAIPEIEARIGYSGFQLSRDLAAMSVELYIHHPMLYAQWVARGWMRFWRPPRYGQARSPGPALESAYRALWPVESVALRGVNLMFLLSACLLIADLFLRRSMPAFDLCAAAIVLVASVLQGMMDFGENARYSVPTAPLVLYVVVVTAWRILTVAPRAAGSRLQERAP